MLLRINFILLLILIPFLSAFGKPVIHFEKYEADLGQKEQATIVSHIFEFTNKGDSVLIIDRVHACCGRSAELLSGSRINPGEKGKIKFSFSTRQRVGKIVEICDVFSNDPENEKVSLYVRVEVKGK